MSGEDSIMRNLIIYTHHKILLGDQIKKNVMDMAHRTYGGEENCMQSFGGEP